MENISFRVVTFGKVEQTRSGPFWRQIRVNRRRIRKSVYERQSPELQRLPRTLGNEPHHHKTNTTKVYKVCLKGLTRAQLGLVLFSLVGGAA